MAVDHASAREQLDLVLGFFERAESKLSVVLTLSVAMLGVFATKVMPVSALSIPACVAGVVYLAVFAVISLKLYDAHSANLKGGHNSLVYFSEIAKRPEAAFIQEYLAASDDDLTRDVLGQVWRNAQILAERFGYISAAQRALAISILPWAAFLMLT